MPKVLCPNHKDTNPSMEVYETHVHCFVCGYRARRGADYGPVQYKKATDIKKKLEYIYGLPKQEIRGLSLPADSDGFYIVWPDGSYYKKRLHNAKIRYIGPRGHRPPSFTIPGKINNEVLYVVEGEINALSLSIAIGNKYPITSPGSVCQLWYLQRDYLNYTTVYVIVDKDIPGVAFGLKCKEELIKHKKRVVLVAVEKDINEILQDEGVEGVRSWAEKNLDLS